MKKSYMKAAIPVIVLFLLSAGAFVMLGSSREEGLAPQDFSVTDTNGNEVSLASVSDKPTLLYFFATWCPYCHEDFEALKKVYPDYEGRISILAISLDVNEDAEKITDYASRNGYGWDFAPGNRDVLAKYSVRFTTTKYAIKDNSIVYQGYGVLDEENWRKLLDGMLKTDLS